MLEPRTSQWLARLQGNGPNLASLGLAALIVIQLASLAISALSGRVKTPQPTAGRPMPARQHAAVDVQSVVSAHLFGVATVDPAAQDPANAPLSSANLVLAGTIASQDPKHGIAIISDGGPAKVFSVGDNVSGASLHSVYLDHVILDRGGTLETLQLPRQVSANRAMPPPPRRAGGDPRTVAAVANIRRMVQQDPGLLDQVMRTVASYDSTAGKLRGFRAYPGRNREIFNKLGLKPGDLVTAINGQTLDDPQRSQDVFNTIQSSDHVTVTVERAGQKQDISLNIAQVAAQAGQELGGDGAPGGGSPPNAGSSVPAPGPPTSTNENPE